MNQEQNEKNAFQSKKYLALMWSLVLWAVVVGGTLAVIVVHPEQKAALSPILLAEVLCCGFVQSGYILGQSGVDAFVRMTAIIVGGRSFTPGKPVPPLSAEPDPLPPKPGIPLPPETAEFSLEILGDDEDASALLDGERTDFHSKSGSRSGTPPPSILT